MEKKQFNLTFVLLIATRYFRSKRRARKTAFSLLSVQGIAVGVLTLIAVISVMNGFQLSFIEPILEIKSFHIQLASDSQSELDGPTLQQLKNLPQVDAVIPFFEFEAIINPYSDQKTPCFVRVIPEDTVVKDRGFAGVFQSGENLSKPDIAALAQPQGIALGLELARNLGLTKGEKATLITFSSAPFTKLQPRSGDFYVEAIFKTGYYPIDASWGFVSLETARTLLQDDNYPLKYGIKLKNKTDDRYVLQLLEPILWSTTYNAQSWRSLNKGFFGALRTEKLMMTFLIGLIFIVVGFNIFHSLRRSVFERIEEIGILKALGATSGSIKNIFIVEGFMIGFIGSTAGLVLGLLISHNIDSILFFIETVTNQSLIPILEAVLRFGDKNINMPRLAIFSKRVFYIDAIKTYLYFGEALFIYLFGILNSTVAALSASRYVSKIHPAVLMRNN